MSQSTKTIREFGAVKSYSAASQLVRGSGALGNLAATPEEVVIVTTTGAATATLGATALGKKKTIVLATDGGDLVVTPSVVIGGTTLTLGDAGDSVTLIYTSAGWVIASNVGAVLA